MDGGAFMMIGWVIFLDDRGWASGWAKGDGLDGGGGCRWVMRCVDV